MYPFREDSRGSRGARDFKGMTKLEMLAEFLVVGQWLISNCMDQIRKKEAMTG